MNVEVVATDLGSLPDGGFEEQTPIFQTDQNFLDRGMSGAHSYQDLSFDNRLAFQVRVGQMRSVFSIFYSILRSGQVSPPWCPSSLFAP